MGPSFVTGTYINTFDGSSHPLGFYPGIINPACTGYYINTNMQVTGATTVTWTKISSSGVVSFTQTGNNISFYLFANSESAVFQVSATNSCGTTSYEFEWQAANCGGTCNAFVVSPNPTSTGNVNVSVPDITNPCNPAVSSAASINSTMPTNNTLLITQVSVFDNTGTLRKVVKEGGTKQSRINLSGLVPGIYYIEITGNNNYIERQKFIMQ